MKGTPTNDKAMQEKMKKQTMAKYGNDKKIAVISNNVKKIMDKKASLKAKMAMKPLKKGNVLSK